MAEQKATISLNIHQRIQQVKKKVKFVRKTGEVSQGREKYKVVTHDEVTKELHEAIADAGINIIMNILPETIQQMETGRSSSGTPRMRFYAHFEVDAINVDDPSDFTGMLIAVHADDYGDKGPGKAYSMAMKIFKLKVFDLETGENEEERPEEQGGTRRATPEETQQLYALIEKSSTTEAAILEYLRKDPTMKDLKDLKNLYYGVWEFCMKNVQAAIDRDVAKDVPQ